MTLSKDDTEVLRRSRVCSLVRLEKASVEMLLMGLLKRRSSSRLLESGSVKCKAEREVMALSLAMRYDREEGNVMKEMDSSWLLERMRYVKGRELKAELSMKLSRLWSKRISVTFLGSCLLLIWVILLFLRRKS